MQYIPEFENFADKNQVERITYSDRTAIPEKCVNNVTYFKSFVIIKRINNINFNLINFIKAVPSDL